MQQCTRIYNLKYTISEYFAIISIIPSLNLTRSYACTEGIVVSLPCAVSRITQIMNPRP